MKPAFRGSSCDAMRHMVGRHAEQAQHLQMNFAGVASVLPSTASATPFVAIAKTMKPPFHRNMSMSRVRRRLPKSIKNFDAIETVANSVAVPSIVPIGMASSLQRMGALYALRMIEGARLHTQMLDRDSIRDHDLLTLCGLELAGHGAGLTVPFLAQAFAAQHKRLAMRGGPRLRVLDENIARLGKSLRLKAVECAMLRLAVVIDRVQQFTNLFRLCIATPTQFFVVVRHATGESERAITAALGADSTLRRIGLLGDLDLNYHRHPLKMDSEIATGLLLPDFDIQRVLRRLLREPPPSTLALEDFSHLRDAPLIRQYLAVAANTRQNGVNVLIHGAPGTGKTEYVRALAQSLKLRLCEVPVEDSQRRPVSGQARFRAFTMAQRLLERDARQLLLFDEVEDVFGREEGSSLRALFGGKSRDPGTLAKGWINETLESNPVPTVWVCNNIRAMDPAYLRRFDLVVEFRSPTQAVRRRIMDRHFGEDVLSPQGIEEIAALDPLPPSQVARAARVVKALAAQSVRERDEQARRILDLSLRAMGYSTKARHAPLPAHYDAALLNTDRDLSTLVDGLRVGRPARLCLYGPPGTGKSALGAHLAQVLDRPLHIKRASDLISMWLGETEKNIADAFTAASDENAILLIDEADSFLRDRADAQRSWEVSQVNEMLMQMEAFEGLFIASTNLVKSLDAASLRRFDFKLKFDYLKREQRVMLFRRVLGDAVIGERERLRIEKLDRFAPGDMANALRQLTVMGQEPDAVRLLELIEGEMALKPDAPRAGIGFVH